jgi:hypothetical protein
MGHETGDRSDFILSLVSCRLSLNSKLLSPRCLAALEHFPAVCRRHPTPEAVYTYAFFLFWLIGSFWHVLIIARPEAGDKGQGTRGKGHGTRDMRQARETHYLLFIEAMNPYNNFPTS